MGFNFFLRIVLIGSVIGIVIWFLFGLVQFLDYCKDVLLSIFIALLTIYLLKSESRLSKLRRVSPILEKRAKEIQKLHEERHIKKERVDEIHTRAYNTKRLLDDSENEHKQIVTLLAWATIITAVLSIIGYFLKLIEDTQAVKYFKDL